MKEPKRLSLSGSATARSLLGAAKRETPPESLGPEVLEALGLTSAAFAPSLLAKLLTGLKHAVVSKVGIGVLAAAAAGGGYVAGRIHEHSIEARPQEVPVATTARAIAPAPPPVRAVSTAVVTPAPTPSESVQAPVVARAPATVPTAVIVASATPVVVPTTPPPPPQPSLAEEAEAIQAIRTLVVAGNGRAALDKLDAYGARHPQGALQEESLALRVRASNLVGDKPAAAKALAELRTRFPGSVHLQALSPP